MATMKRLMTEHYDSPMPDEQTHHQRQMNHHSTRALEASRLSRGHALQAEHYAANPDTNHSLAGHYASLSKQYGEAAKMHLTLADHHAVHFKKERNDTIKDMTKPLKPAIGGKDGVK